VISTDRSELFKSRPRPHIARLERKNGLIFATVILGVVIFVAGVASYPLLFPTSRSSTTEGLPIGGYFFVNAYHSNGQLFASWQGHNTVTANGVSGLAQCLSGQHLPSNFGSCSGGVSAYVFVEDIVFNEWRASATNALYPLGCNPNANPGTCTGWQAKGVINFSSGAFPATITKAGTEGTDAGAGIIDLVGVGPLTVNMGDYLTVTVVFSIT
jgi:hypothetical protein